MTGKLIVVERSGKIVDMQNRSTLILGGLTAAGIIYLVSRAGEVVKDRIKIDRPRAKDFRVDFSNLRVQFSLTFPLTNALPIALPSNRFNGGLYFDGIRVGDVDTIAVNVPSGATRDLETFVILSIGNVLQSLTNIASDPQRLFNALRIRGEFTSNGISFPYESSIRLIG